MFAIIRVGGKQYRVEQGTQVLVDRLHVEPGSSVEGVEVLMLADGDDVQIGAPVVEGVSVGATAVRHHLGKKIRVFKYKAKKNYRRRIGSRPHQTLIRIDSIGDGSQNGSTASSASAPASVPIAETSTVETAPAMTQDASIAQTVETVPVAQDAPALETGETIPAVAADTTTETPEVEAVAVVDAANPGEAVAAIEEIPGVESVEVTDTPAENA